VIALVQARPNLAQAFAGAVESGIGLLMRISVPVGHHALLWQKPILHRAHRIGKLN